VFEGISLLDLSGLGAIGGAVVGVLVYELFHYWYHRATPTSGTGCGGRDTRCTTAPRASTPSVPTTCTRFDAAMFTTLGSLVFFPLLG
jgi:hypothetical protein